MVKRKPPKKAAKPKPEAKSRARTPPFPPYPAWTTARFWSFLRSGLRSCYGRYPVKFDVLKAAKRPYVGPDKRTKFEYQCAECKEWFKSSAVSVDHIIPAGALNSFEDIAGFVERLFVGPEGLQVLCKTDHDRKTKTEREER